MILNKLAGVSVNFRNRWVVLLCLLCLLFLFDIALYLLDLFVGEEPGIVFSFKLSNIILVSNLAAIGITVLFMALFYMARQFALIKKYVINFLLSLASLVATLILIEGIFYILIAIRASDVTPSPYPMVVDDNVFHRDEVLGFSLNENASHHYKALLIDPANDTSSVLYDNEILTDSAGFRKVEIADMERRSKYALFFGCSFTFGTGVDGKETVPYLFAREDTTFAAYNFAVSGYGPQCMLAQLEFKDLKSLVSQDSGVCFYTFIPDHIPRAIGDMRIVNSFGLDLPYYDYDNGLITYKGTFRNGRSLISSLYYLLGKSNFFQYYNINLPPSGLESHYIKTCDIIDKARQEYEKQFKNDNFYVIIYPGDEAIVPYLNKYNIHVLNFGKAFEKQDKEILFYPHDGHPTPYANGLFTQQLLNSLSIITNEKYK